MADPDDCRKYHHCLPDGRVFAMQCPDGLVFDARRKVCVWDSIAQSCAPDRGLESTPKPQQQHVPSTTTRPRASNTQSPSLRTTSPDSSQRGKSVKSQDSPSPPVSPNLRQDPPRRPEPDHRRPKNYDRGNRNEDRNHGTSPRRPSPEAPTAPATTIAEAAPTAPSQTPESMVVMEMSTRTTSFSEDKPITTEEGRGVVRSVKADGESILWPSLRDESNAPQPSSDHQSSSLFPWSQRRHFVYRRSPRDNLVDGDIHCPTGYAYIPDPSSCSSFYHCYNWQPMKKVCPHGLFFDIQMNVCNWQQNVKCFDGDRGESRFTFDKMMRPYKNAPRRTMKTGGAKSQKAEKGTKAPSTDRKVENKKMATTGTTTTNVPKSVLKTLGTSSQKILNDGKIDSVKKTTTVITTPSTPNTSTETPTTTTASTTSFMAEASSQKFREGTSSFTHSNPPVMIKTITGAEEAPVTRRMLSSTAAYPAFSSSISKTAPLTTAQVALDRQRSILETQYQPVEDVNPFKLQSKQKSVDEKLSHFNSFLNSPTAQSTSLSTSSQRPTPELPSLTIITSLPHDHTTRRIVATAASQTRTQNESYTRQETDNSISNVTVTAFGAYLGNTKETNTTTSASTVNYESHSTTGKADTVTALPAVVNSSNSSSAGPTNITGAESVHENPTILSLLSMPTYFAAQNEPAAESAERHQSTTSSASHSTSVPTHVLKFILSTVTKVPALNPTVTEASALNPSVTEASALNPYMTETSALNPTVTEASALNPSVTEASALNPSVTETSALNPSATEASALNPSVTEASALNPPVTEAPPHIPSAQAAARVTKQEAAPLSEAEARIPFYAMSNLRVQPITWMNSAMMVGDTGTSQKYDHSPNTNRQAMDSYSFSGFSHPAWTSYTPSTLLFRKFVRSDRHGGSLEDVQIEKFMAKVLDVPDKSQHVVSIPDSHNQKSEDKAILSEKTGDSGLSDKKDENVRYSKFEERRQTSSGGAFLKDYFTTEKNNVDLSEKTVVNNTASVPISWLKTQTRTTTHPSSAVFSATPSADDGSENLTTPGMNTQNFLPQLSKKAEHENRVTLTTTDTEHLLSQHRSKKRGNKAFLISHDLRDGLKFYEVDYPGEARTGVPKIQVLSAHAEWGRPKEDQIVADSHAAPDSVLIRKLSGAWEEDLQRVNGDVPTFIEPMEKEKPQVKKGTDASNFRTGTHRHSINFTSDSGTKPSSEVLVSTTSTETTSQAQATMALMDHQTTGCKTTNCSSTQTESKLKFTQDPIKFSTEALASRPSTTSELVAQTDISTITPETKLSTVEGQFPSKGQADQKSNSRTEVQTNEADATRQAGSDESKHGEVFQHVSHFKAAYINDDNTAGSRESSDRSRSSSNTQTVAPFSHDKAVNRSTDESLHKASSLQADDKTVNTSTDELLHKASSLQADNKAINTSTDDLLHKASSLQADVKAVNRSNSESLHKASSIQADNNKKPELHATEELRQEIQTYSAKDFRQEIQTDTTKKLRQEVKTNAAKASTVQGQTSAASTTENEIGNVVMSTILTPNTTGQSQDLTHPLMLNPDYNTTADTERSQSFSAQDKTSEKNMLLDASRGENTTSNLTVSTLVVSVQVEEKQNITLLRAYNISTFSIARDTVFINRTEMLDLPDLGATKVSTERPSTVSANLDNTSDSRSYALSPEESNSVNVLEESKHVPAAYLAQGATTVIEKIVQDFDKGNEKNSNISESSVPSAANSDPFQTVNKYFSTITDSTLSIDFNGVDSTTSSKNSFIPGVDSSEGNIMNMTIAGDSVILKSSGDSLKVLETTARDSDLSTNSTITTPAIGVQMSLTLIEEQGDEKTRQQLNTHNADSKTGTTTTTEYTAASSEKSVSADAAVDTELKTAINKTSYYSLQEEADPQGNDTEGKQSQGTSAEDRHPKDTRVEGLSTKGNVETTTAVENDASTQSLVSLKDLITWYLKHWKNNSNWRQDLMTSAPTNPY